MKTIAELRARSGSLDQETFARRHPRPAFVLETDFDDVSGLPVDTPDENALGTTTVSSRGAVVPVIESGTLVYFLEKTARNPFSTMITIGRAANNDVVVAVPTVSKLHATVIERDGALCLRDEGSTNGTRLDGRPLSQGEQARLEPGASVALAPGIALRYHSPESLHSLVTS